MDTDTQATSNDNRSEQNVVMSSDGDNILSQRPRIAGYKSGELRPVTNREQGIALAEKRWGMWRKAAVAGMVAGVLTETTPLTKANQVMAYSAIVQKQAEAALVLTDNGTANTAAARFVREAIGADIGAPKRGNDGGVNVGVAVSISLDVGDSVERLLRERGL